MFGLSEIGHFFCPFLTFPKKSWKKKVIFHLFKYKLPKQLKEYQYINCQNNLKNLEKDMQILLNTIFKKYYIYIYEFFFT
jgi:hypothetical protein